MVRETSPDVGPRAFAIASQTAANPAVTEIVDLSKTPGKRPLKVEDPNEDLDEPPSKRRLITEMSPSLAKSAGKRRATGEEPGEGCNPQSPTPKAGGTSVSRTPETPKTRSSHEKAQTKAIDSLMSPRTPSRNEESRQRKDKEYGRRNWLFKREVLDWHKYTLGTSDLVAIPARIEKNDHHEEAPDTRCYRVCHLNWLQDQIDKGNGLFLPLDSTANEDNPLYVVENGAIICKEDAMKLQPYKEKQLNSKQLNRLRKCGRKPRVGGGPRCIDHWNVCDIDALLEQGENLKGSCPPSPEITDFDISVTSEVAKQEHGLSEDDLAKIEPGFYNEGNEKGEEPEYSYNLWDILKLKAACKAGTEPDDLITHTKARNVYEVSHAQLNSIEPAALLYDAPYEGGIITYYHLSDVETLAIQLPGDDVKPHHESPKTLAAESSRPDNHAHARCFA